MTTYKTIKDKNKKQTYTSRSYMYKHVFIKRLKDEGLPNCILRIFEGQSRNYT